MTYQDYLKTRFNPGSGATSSYITAIDIIDDIFKKKDVFNLNGTPLTEIRDPLLINEIIDYIVIEEGKFRLNEESIFDLGSTKQTSYPKKRFCTGAIKKLGEYVNLLCCNEATEYVKQSDNNDIDLSRKLLKMFNIDDKGTEKEVTAKHRIGQDLFRAILLDIYDSKCCLTGIEIPEVLRASHIIPWAANKDTRLSPENGLCLSATYDAAFDQHLISFDEEYKLVLSPRLKDRYTSEAFKTHFLKYEGTRINLPARHCPSQTYLEDHRKHLAS